MSSTSICLQHLPLTAAMEDFQSVKDNLQASLVSTIKAVNRIASQDLSFQRTINPEVDERLDKSTERVLNLANRLLKAAPKPGRDSVPQLEEAEDIDLNWRRIVDVVDATFEKADVALDEYTGLIKRKEPPGEAENVGGTQVFCSIAQLLTLRPASSEEAEVYVRATTEPPKCEHHETPALL